MSQILALVKEEDLLTELSKFEDSIYASARPLRELLSKDIRSTDVVSTLDHMTEVERWRERVCRWNGLAVCFVDHCKSDHFLVPKEKGVTDVDRAAYQKRLMAGFVGLQSWLEGLIYCIDSRVNLAKKLVGIDEQGTRSTRMA